MTQKAFPPEVDLEAASPVGDLEGFHGAFEAVRPIYPGVEVTHVGTDGCQHFFQLLCDAVAYVAPVSAKWRLRGQP